MTEFGLWREPIRRLISKISCLAPIYRAQNKNFFVEEFICLISRFLRKPLSNILCWLANNITTCLKLDTFGRTMKPGEGKLVDLYFPKFSWGNSWRVFQLEICLFWAFSKANSIINMNSSKRRYVLLSKESLQVPKYGQFDLYYKEFFSCVISKIC